MDFWFARLYQNPVEARAKLHADVLRLGSDPPIKMLNANPRFYGMIPTDEFKRMILQRDPETRIPLEGAIESARAYYTAVEKTGSATPGSGSLGTEATVKPEPKPIPTVAPVPESVTEAPKTAAAREEIRAESAKPEAKSNDLVPEIVELGKLEEQKLTLEHAYRGSRQAQTAAEATQEAVTNSSARIKTVESAFDKNMESAYGANSIDAKKELLRLAKTEGNDAAVRTLYERPHALAPVLHPEDAQGAVASASHFLSAREHHVATLKVARDTMKLPKNASEATILRAAQDQIKKEGTRNTEIKRVLSETTKKIGKESFAQRFHELPTEDQMRVREQLPSTGKLLREEPGRDERDVSIRR